MALGFNEADAFVKGPQSQRKYLDGSYNIQGKGDDLSLIHILFQSAFYPYLKSEIKKSWERIFDIDNTEQTNLGAAVWQLRQEDVVGINSHSARCV